MRTISTMITATLIVALAAQAMYIMKTRRDVQALTQQVAALSGNEGRVADPGDSPGNSGAPDSPSPERLARRPTPPRFALPTAAAAPAPSADPLPLPALLESQEAREQLRQFVAAQIVREKEEEQQKREQQRQEQQQRARDNIVKGLNLDPEKAAKFDSVLSSFQTAQKEMRDKIAAGQVQGPDIGRQFTAMRDQVETDMKGLLGDDGFAKLQQLSRQNGRGGGLGLPMGGRGGGGWGGPGGGGPPGGGGLPGGGPPAP